MEESVNKVHNLKLRLVKWHPDRISHSLDSEKVILKIP